MYHILTDKLYLYLLAFYDDEPFTSYTQLAEETGLTRQTVKTRMDKLKENSLVIIEDGFVLVDNIMDIDVELLKQMLQENTNQYYIAAFFYKQEHPYATIKEIAKGIGVSFTSLAYYNIKNDQLNDIKNHNEKKTAIIYAIIQNGKIVYVGSSFVFEEHIKQHIRLRPLLTEDNFIILEECSVKDRFKVERGYIHQFHPEWNIASNEKKGEI